MLGGIGVSKGNVDKDQRSNQQEDLQKPSIYRCMRIHSRGGLRLTSFSRARLPEVRGLPQEPDGLHEDVLDNNAAVGAGEPIRTTPEVLEVGL